MSGSLISIDYSICWPPKYLYPSSSSTCTKSVIESRDILSLYMLYLLFISMSPWMCSGSNIPINAYTMIRLPPLRLPVTTARSPLLNVKLILLRISSLNVMWKFLNSSVDSCKPYGSVLGCMFYCWLIFLLRRSLKWCLSYPKPKWWLCALPFWCLSIVLNIEVMPTSWKSMDWNIFKLVLPPLVMPIRKDIANSMNAALVACI